MRNLLRSIVFILMFVVSFQAMPGYCQDDTDKPALSELITISEGIDMALKNNRLIKVTLPDKEMSFQNSLVERSALLPQLNLNATKTFYKFQAAANLSGVETPTSERMPLSYGMDVYQTLFDFGKSLFNFKASRDLVEATKANIESVKRIVTLEVVTMYFNLLESEKMIAVFEKEAESLFSYLNDIERLYTHGAAVKNDLLPAQVRLADAKQRLITANNEKEIAAARLKNILALSLRDEIRVEDIEMQSPQFPEMELAWKTAEQERPEVAFYEDQIKASVSTERAKAVENFPTIYADAGYAYGQNQFQSHQTNMSLVLGAKMNLYDGGASVAELLKERARQKQLKEQKVKLVEDIKLEIEDSYFSLKNACEKVDVARDAVSQSEENLRVYRVKYNAGSATPTDVLAAITLQTRAQSNYYTSDYELKRNYAKLMYSMGIDLSLIYSRMEKQK